LSALEGVLRKGVQLHAPEGSFARHVYESVNEEGPVPSWQAMPVPTTLRQGHAPALAASGYQIASASTACPPDLLDAWQAGLQRLSCKDAFASDRQTFAYRPLEVFGICTGAGKIASIDGNLLAWLKGVLLRLEREVSNSGWAGQLCEAAAAKIGAKWQSSLPVNLPLMRSEELALRRWLLSTSIGNLSPENSKLGPAEIDAELLRRAVSSDLTSEDVACAAVLYYALRAATHERLESDLACTWQIGRETQDALVIVTNLCRRFYLFARQIQSRHAKRTTVVFKDEYDVQDAMHALLRLHFDDVRPEEWAPSYAGNASRMDFLLKREHVVVEVKMTRKGLDQKEVVNQLTEDKERYRTHADCRALVCFVYDPAGICQNPTALEDDVSMTKDDFRVVVVVAPKGT
jgi:hypothetical protein